MEQNVLKYALLIENSALGPGEMVSRMEGREMHASGDTLGVLVWWG
jgi:hypothetical protein